MTYLSSPNDTGVHDEALVSTCINGDSHFFDWCHAGISEFNDVLVIFFVTILLVLAAPFTFGLIMLWLVQLRNFCLGMTTMERMGSEAHRNRVFSFVEQIVEVANEQSDRI